MPTLTPDKIGWLIYLALLGVAATIAIIRKQKQSKPYDDIYDEEN